MYLWDLPKHVCTMDIHFDWQACASSVIFAFRLRCESILHFALQGLKKALNNYDFQSSQSSQENIHPSSFFSSRSFSARVLLATQRPQIATRRQYNAMSTFKPKCPFFVHFLVFLWRMDIGLHFNGGNMFRNVSALFDSMCNMLTTATCSVT